MEEFVERTFRQIYSKETFTCNAYSLQFFGILAFAAHDDATTSILSNSKSAVSAQLFVFAVLADVDLDVPLQ